MDALLVIALVAMMSYKGNYTRHAGNFGLSPNVMEQQGYRDVAKFGIAPDLGSGERRFKSCHSEVCSIIIRIFLRAPRVPSRLLWANYLEI